MTLKGEHLEMNSVPAKDVIYIDVDDEITTIIDKVRASSSKIVALVLPKRATMLQSIVNMKLLKKSADNDKKHLVLITAEAGLLPLAAATELFVAKNLQTKPEIPDVQSLTPLSSDVQEDDTELQDITLDRSQPIGALAGKTPGGSPKVGAAGSALTGQSDNEIDMSDEVYGSSDDDQNANPASTDVPKKDKSRKVPNFNKFRLRLILGGCGLILLIVLYVICFKVLPSAAVVIKTNSQEITTNANLTLSPAATSVNTTSMTLPAQAQKLQKTFTQQAAATGQQNNGQKATGTISMSAGTCSGTAPADVAAGTGVTSNGLTFITQNSVTFTPVVDHGKCTWQAAKAVTIVAQNGGAQYNIAASSFVVAGRSDVSAGSSSAMTGGTDNITKIVQQSDIDSAKAKLDGQDNANVKTQLQNQLTSAGLMPVTATFAGAPPTVTTSANAGDAADNVTVTEVTNFTMLGVKQTDLQQAIAASIKDQFDAHKQSILDYGLGSANFGTPTQSGDNTQISLQTAVVVGPDLKTAQIIPEIAGKKTGDVTQIIKSTPGVTDVTVKYSPFWVTAMPTKQSKITVTIDKPQNTKSK